MKALVVYLAHREQLKTCISQETQTVKGRPENNDGILVQFYTQPGLAQEIKKRTNQLLRTVHTIRAFQWKEVIGIETRLAKVRKGVTIH